MKRRSFAAGGGAGILLSLARPARAAFGGAGSMSEIMSGSTEGLADLTLTEIPLNRLSDRRQLLSSIDAVQRVADERLRLPGVDRFTEQAASILTSGSRNIES